MGGWMGGQMEKWMGNGREWIDRYGWVGRWIDGYE